MKKKTGKAKEDRILTMGKSPLDYDHYWEGEKGEEGWTELGDAKEVLTVSGKLGLGKDGHPVTIRVTDEVTGMELELGHVNNALLVIEDTRESSSGWLSMIIGDIRQVGDVLRFIAKATLEELKGLMREKKREN